ncbi:hypothetical protein ACMZ45_19295, partial [Acinetobacter baumannii]|uniref:hypothetical protein n=1 Tax=Acinetobacter baumannii TaxID=470 RepID=UPI0039EFC13E
SSRLSDASCSSPNTRNARRLNTRCSGGSVTGLIVLPGTSVCLRDGAGVLARRILHPRKPNVPALYSGVGTLQV